MVDGCSRVGAIWRMVLPPVALVRGDVYCWGLLMAACLITRIPIAVLYTFFLDRFIAGFTVGAINDRAARLGPVHRLGLPVERAHLARPRRLHRRSDQVIVPRVLSYGPR